MNCFSCQTVDQGNLTKRNLMVDFWPGSKPTKGSLSKEFWQFFSYESFSKFFVQISLLVYSLVKILQSLGQYFLVKSFGLPENWPRKVDQRKTDNGILTWEKTQKEKFFSQIFLSLVKISLIILSVIYIIYTIKIQN